MIKIRLKLVAPRLACHPCLHAMNLLRQAHKQEIEGPKKKKPDSDVDIIEVSDRDPTESWRRLGIRLLLVVNLAQKQVMLEELSSVTIQKASIPEDAWCMKESKPKGIGVTRAEIMWRVPLPPRRAL